MTGPVDLLIGGLFVLVSAMDRFNTPHTNRSSTTILRFYMAEISYVAVGVVSYLLLVKVPRLIEILGGDTTSELGSYLSQPMLVALILTVLLPKIPLLSDVDEWIRKQLQKMGAIPFEARRLSAELRRSEFQVPPQRQAEVRKKMLDDGFASEDVCFEDRQSLEYLWTKISALILQLEEWETDRRFVGFMARFAPEFNDIKMSYQWLSRRAKGCFRLARDLSSDGGAVRADEMVLQYQKDFMEQCLELFRKICVFISRGLLQCGPTYGARAGKLRSLGFHVEVSAPPLTLNQLMLMFGVLGITTLSGFVLIPGAGNPRFEELLARAAMVSVIYSVAVICAVYPKEKWPFARRDPNDVRPVAFYFVAGGLAAVMGLVVSFLFNCLIFGNLERALARMSFSYPWMTIAFVSAFTTAWLIDDRPTAQISRIRLQWLEAIAHSVALTVAACLVHFWISDLVNSDAAGGAYVVPPLVSLMLRSAAVGLVIGYCVPTWFREAPRANEGPEGLHCHDKSPSLPNEHSAKPGVC